MELTEKNKEYIDSLSYEQLLSRWHLAPIGNSWFQGETGMYWEEIMVIKVCVDDELRRLANANSTS